MPVRAPNRLLVDRRMTQPKIAAMTLAIRMREWRTRGRREVEENAENQQSHRQPPKTKQLPCDFNSGGGIGAIQRRNPLKNRSMEYPRRKSHHSHSADAPPRIPGRRRHREIQKCST